MKYYIETFGCQMNEYDSFVLAGILEADGWLKAANIDEADLVLVNTCCIRQSAEKRIMGHIGSLKRLKKAKPSMLIAVCGCLPQKSGAYELFKEQYRHVDILLGTYSQSKIALYARQALEQGGRIYDLDERYDSADLSCQAVRIPAGERPFKAQLSIIYGCNNFCSYCIVPYVRGRERSKDPRLILDEVAKLALGGCKEIQLLGQNVNSYGHDLADSWNFARLLQQVAQIDGIERVRYMTSHPRDFTAELLETIAAEKKICKHFHLPVQSGCDRILKEMNRGYETKNYLRILQGIRQAVPGAAITTDLICGFPGETEADFKQTLDFIKEAQFDAAYTFIYSQRSCTPAAQMPDQVVPEVKKDRLNRLMDIQNPISLAINQKMVGESQIVLVEGLSKSNDTCLSGRTDNNKLVNFAADGSITAGNLVAVKIIAAKTWNLIGEC